MISVFGASGFIGKHFCETFNNEAIVQDRSDRVSETNSVLFLASTVDNYNVFIDPTLDIYTNEFLPIEILENTRKKFGSNFTFNYVSSWFVYGELRGLPAKETDPCDPKGMYSITRYSGEKLVQSYCETFGIPWRVLRLGSIIGRGDKKASLKKNAVLHLIQEIATGNPVKIYSSPSYRDFMDVRDCVRAIELVMRRGEINEVYNIGSGSSTNVKRLIEKVHAQVGKAPLEYMEVPTFHKQVQTPVMILNVQKLQNLDFYPEYTLDDTVEWILGEHENRQ